MVGGIIHGMRAGPHLRRASASDSRECFAIFRTSLRDLMQRTGYLPADAPPLDLDAQWPGYVALFEHLATSCAEWWVAFDELGVATGYARATEREGHRELTEFFVRPGCRVGGVGRALLERAFPRDSGMHRSIIATTDAAAVALYLRFGVHHQSTGVGLAGAPRSVRLPAGYEEEPATPDAVERLERTVLGHARAADIRFMLSDRPAVLVRHGGEPVAYAFLPNGRGEAGPVAARDPVHLPAALARVEQAAYDAGIAELELAVPLAASTAIAWLLGERRFRIDPFYCLFLADSGWAQLDRYLPFNPCLIL
jgi:GNAT superfamily N-acetyltransferase